MSARYVKAVVAILVLTAGYACWCRAPLIWDGAYQFNTTLIMQRPYFYLTRFHTYFLWWPTVWASRVTDNVMLLQAIYGLPFLLAPAVGLLLSWWMVRDHAPRLIIWAVFGVAASTLPGQIFVINDSIFQQHLFWPVFLGMMMPLNGRKKAVIALLMVFQFVHPIGMLLLGGAAIALGLIALTDPQRRKHLAMRAGVLAGVALLALGKLFITTRIPALYDSYAQQEAAWSTALDRWRAGVRGWPLRGLWFVWAAGAMLFLQFMWETKRPGLARAMGRLALPCAALGCALWVYWAGDGRLWWKALDYRRWILPLTAPFFIFATVEACIAAVRRRALATGLPIADQHALMAKQGVLTYAGPGATALRPSHKPEAGDEWQLLAAQSWSGNFTLTSRNALGLVLAASFAIVLGLQCTVWRHLGDRLMATVRGYHSPVVPEAAISFLPNGPLDHWGTADFVVAMQGKQPRTLLLDPRGQERLFESPPKIPHWDFYPHPPDPSPGPIGWFDLRPLLAKLPANRAGRAPDGPVRLDIKTTPD